MRRISAVMQRLEAGGFPLAWWASSSLRGWPVFTLSALRLQLEFWQEESKISQQDLCMNHGNIGHRVLQRTDLPAGVSTIERGQRAAGQPAFVVRVLSGLVIPRLG
jgi:hypothetical protein